MASICQYFHSSQHEAPKVHILIRICAKTRHLINQLNFSGMPIDLSWRSQKSRQSSMLYFTQNKGGHRKNCRLIPKYWLSMWQSIRDAVIYGWRIRILDSRVINWGTRLSNCQWPLPVWHALVRIHHLKCQMFRRISSIVTYECSCHWTEALLLQKTKIEKQLTAYSVEQIEIRTFGTSRETINDFQHGLIHFSINWSDDISYKHLCSEV
jgi:hypothetical protein